MRRSIRAIYENGVFHPLDALDGLRERAAVTLQFEEVAESGATLADFAGRWPIDEADRITAIIEAEFERVDVREW